MELIAENLGKRYFRKTGSANYFEAVHPVSFSLKPGRLTVLTGRSGSGKTTLLNLLAGLLTHDLGRVLADGQDLYAMDDPALSRFRNRHIGVMPQGQTALQALTVLENVLLPVSLYGDPAKNVGRARELLLKLGLGELISASPRSLSGGELRSMSIARALIQEPEALLCDEPTGDLDDENTRLVLETLRDTAHSGVAVLLVTHESDALAYADAAWHMNAGTLEIA